MCGQLRPPESTSRRRAGYNGPQSMMVTVSILYLSITFNYDVGPQKGFFETLNGRLPHQISSVRLQTLSKRVSGDPQHFIFRRRRFFFGIFRTRKFVFCYFGQDIDEIRTNGPRQMIPGPFLL